MPENRVGQEAETKLLEAVLGDLLSRCESPLPAIVEAARAAFNVRTPRLALWRHPPRHLGPTTAVVVRADTRSPAGASSLNSLSKSTAGAPDEVSPGPDDRGGVDGAGRYGGTPPTGT
ncbi:MAG: hypothetical protein ACRD1K_05515 [Acidimicrobiales bacterium]